LEEKQRLRRRERENEAERAAAEGRPYPPYEPTWFDQKQEDNVENLEYVYRGGYWDCKTKQDWSKCPGIF
jgi:oxysterol-binding protein 1